MQGIELARRMRSVRSRDRLAVIGVSGTEDPGLVAHFLKNGANDFLRGFAPERTRDNLDWMLTEFGRSDIPVLLAEVLDALIQLIERSAK